MTILRPMGLPVYVTIVVLFAFWATIHLQLCLKLARRSLWRAVIGFFIPPLAIYYAQDVALGRLTPLWVVSLSAYLVALTLGFIG